MSTAFSQAFSTIDAGIFTIDEMGMPFLGAGLGETEMGFGAGIPVAALEAAVEMASPALSPAKREQLILEHLPQVRLIARRIHERLPGSVNLDDLISTGSVGLISAIDRFDPTLNVKLKTYAEYKIRGAILDSLRGLDWAPRQHRKRSKQIEAAITKIEQELQRAPTEEEVAAHLGITIEAYHEQLVELQGLNVGSLETATPDDEGSRDLLNFISDDKESWPSSLMERSELQKVLADAIGKMPEIEKTVLSLYYYEELTLREISKIVRLHESRISQLKSQAILRLRAYMAKAWPCPRGI
ncbi:MAG TPA: FliA/WhiG family RNA polymerase sigma factor [Bryobacteraceae bacterium]|jgi:RNA polymerase sigma factor for flagellar operon FliA